MRNEETVLSLTGVTKTFGTKTAVNDVSLDILAGEIFGFLGPNGAGKSTTIRLVLDIIRPTCGSVELFGEPNSRVVSTHYRLGYLAGDMVLDEDLTGRQYLDFVAKVYSKDLDDEIKRLAGELQADLKIKIGNYSRGNRQKIGLIAALMHRPQLLVLDEPTSGFDPLVQDKFVQLMREFRDNGGTVFMSSHILAEVRELCDRIGFIKDGVFAGAMGIAELTRSAAKQVNLRAEQAVITEIKRGVSKLKGLTVRSAEAGEASLVYNGDPRALLKFLAGYRLLDVVIEEPDLEAVFLDYYKPAKEKQNV